MWKMLAYARTLVNIDECRGINSPHAGVKLIVIFSSVKSSGPPVEWIRNHGRYFLFPMSNFSQNPDSDRDEEEDMVEFTVTGAVVNALCDANAKSHTITENISRGEVDAIDALVRTSPNFTEYHYRWRFAGTNAKFTSKDDISSEFPSVWDGKEIGDSTTSGTRFQPVP